ncbi:MAG: phosphotransferase [Aestuariivirga sp.]|nr:phosphotransferase [Aestuariivirga sp.]
MTSPPCWSLPHARARGRHERGSNCSQTHPRASVLGRACHRGAPEGWALQRELEGAQIPLPIVFGHHDLLPGNFLDDGERLWLIDFEYAGFGTTMFDIAGATANAEMDEAQSEALLTAYFDMKPDEATWRAFDAMQGRALIREAMWAMVSDIHLAARWP